MVTRGLALELAPLGIRVVSVAPGVIATERNVEAAFVGESLPLGRAGTPGEVEAAGAAPRRIGGPTSPERHGHDWPAHAAPR
jgi:NAD(P)-dependent dehydrogenase (short-subunit alcohol dehydrogenase family)